MDMADHVFWLRELKNLKSRINVGLIGMGAMGKGLFYQIHKTPGFECVALCDLRLEKAIACATWMNRPYKVVGTLAGLNQAIRDGVLAICEDGSLLAQGEGMEVLIESSNAPSAGGEFALTALRHQKHVIMMNAETDLIFGPYLAHLAAREGVVYSSCDGDQHGVIRHLLDEVALWGFEVVMAGNIKGFLDRTATPESIIPEADKRNLDYRQATAYTDGTKLGVEMALLANAFGFDVLVPGMLGPRANHVRDVTRLFDFESLYRPGKPFVDYILGAQPDGGVFVVGRCDDPYQKSMMTYYKMGDGPFYVFYRPYHLCHVEALKEVAKAFLYGRSLLKPDHGFRANVYAYAKHDLHAHDTLDGIGGFACYGMIENATGPHNPGLPICLAEDVRLRRDVAKGEKILLEDIECPDARFDFDLFRKACEVVPKPESERLS